MSAAGFQGRGSNPRGRKVRGIPSGIIGARIPQPTYNPPRREVHGIPNSPGEYWLEHSPPIPWQQMNGIPPPQPYSNYESHRYRGGRPQFCSGLSIRGRRGRIRGESDRERPRPGILPDHNYHPGVRLARTETDPLRFPPLGSEEERQKKIAETADKLKQKLSSLDIGEPAHFWEDDSVGVSFANDNEEYGVATKGIPELRHDPPELNLTINDFKDIGRVDPDNCVNSSDSAKTLSSKREVLEDTGGGDHINLHQSDQKKHKNSREEVTENLSNKKIILRDGNGRGISIGEKEASNSSRNDSQMRDEEETIKRDNRLTGTEKIDDEKLKFPSRIEREALKVIERKKNSDLKLQKLTKSLEKLRNVIKVDKELEKKEAKSGLQNESRTIFQADNMPPRLQPDVRLDFHSAIGPGYQRFQGFGHTGGPLEMRNRFQGPFRPENPMEMQPNFPPDYQQRFDPGLRNFNIPRMIPPEYGGPIPPRIHNRNSDLQMGFDPREHSPRFNHPQRQDHPNNQSWFTRNELPQKYGVPDNINGLQPSPAFDPRGPPPRFLNQEQEMNIFRPNIGPPSEFQQIMPMGYPPAQHSHMRHQSTYFNPPMPPLNTAPCIIPEIPQHSVPPSIKNQPTLQPPPIPTGALQLQPHIPLPRSSPPRNSSPGISLPPFSSSQNHTPNMNEELEDMQEAMEFAKKLMNMTEEEEIAAHEFEMPIFPDLPPIPSTEPSHLTEKLTILETPKESIQTEEKECVITKDKRSPEPAPQIHLDKSIPKDSLQSTEEEETSDISSEDQFRVKVAFNLTTKTKTIRQFHSEWSDQISEGSSRDKRDELSMDFSTISQSVQERKSDVKLRENRNNRRNKAQMKEDEKIRESDDTNFTSDDNLLQKENQVENVVESSGKIVDEFAKRRSTGSKIVGKTLAASVVDANWKDKVINQFLKMSKNDICNMVNSSGLRKFDIAMKHLVKERKYSLSQERRCSADDAVKGGAYDMSREEFMSQLSAMLDPSATVDVNNLPSKFIQHLSEVLKLDVQSHINDSVDFVEQNDASNNFDNVNLLQDDHNLHPTSEPQSFADSLVNTNEHFDPNVEMQVVLNQEARLSLDYGKIFTNIDNESNSSPNAKTWDNIDCAQIGNSIETREIIPFRKTTDETSQGSEGEHVSLGLIRARCTKTLMSEENIAMKGFFSSEIASPKQMEIDNSDSETRASGTYESGNEWRKRTRPDPDMFRNLSEEDRRLECIRSTESLNERDAETWSRTQSSGDTSLRARSRSPRSINRNSRSHRSRHVSSPTLLKEKNCNLSIIVHTTNDAADKWSKATEDESFVEKDYNDLGSVSGTLIDSDRSNSPNVIKILKVNKDRENKTKDISRNDIAMDEINTVLEYGKGREERDEIDSKIRKWEKNSGRKASKHCLKLPREEEIVYEVHEEILTPITNEKITHEVPFIKQEELIIEADNELCFETTSDSVTLHETGKGNSQSNVDRNKETLSEMSCQEHNEILGPLEETLNTQEMHIAQEYEKSLSMLDLKREFSQDSHQSSVAGGENFLKDLEIESSPRAETPVRLFEGKETSNTSNDAAESQISKSGTKKIDIKAYKARKLQRDFGKRTKSKGIEVASDSPNIDATNAASFSQEPQQDSAKERQTENVSGDLGSDKCEQNAKSGSTKDLSIDSPDSRASIHHKEKSPAPEVKYDKKRHRREERKSSKERSTRSDKKRSRTHSRERGRSTLREGRCRFSRQNSKHSSQDRHHSSHARSVSLDKSRGKTTHQNNNIVGLKDRKTTRYGACDSPKELYDKIEKRHSRSRKKFSEEKTEGNEIRRKNNDKERSPASIRHGITTDERKSKKEDIGMMKNCDLPEKTEHVAKNHEEIITTDTILVENSEITSTELNTSQKSPEAALHDVKTQDYVNPSSSQNQNMPSNHQEKPTVKLTSETADPECIQVDNSKETAAEESPSKENDLIQNETEGSSLQDPKMFEVNDLKDTENEFQQNEANTESDLFETIQNSVTHRTEATLENMSEVELQQPSEDDMKSILNNLIDKVVSQVDLLSSDIEAKETKEVNASEDIKASSELVSASKNKKESQEFEEDNAMDLYSPKTPDSPLKGFSENSIETSIMGKRRLAQSVLQITEDYNTPDENSKIFENYLLDTNCEGANVPVDHNDQIVKKNSEKINSELETINIVTAERITADVFKRKFEITTVASEKNVCVTPSGDTLSLGSPIDFGNSEFIVLSEVSSDENRSHDRNCRLQISTNPEMRELRDVKKSNVENQNAARKKENEEGVDSSESVMSTKNRVSRNIKTQQNTEETELLATHSELDTKVETLAKSAAVQDNAEENCNPSIEDPETSVLAKSLVETTEQLENSKNIVKKEESHVEPSSKSTLKKGSVAEDDDPSSKISAHKKNCKTDEGKHINTSNENNADKNLHGVKHRHRTKHKKNKKYKLNEKQMKEVLRNEDLVTIVKKRQTKEGVMARMVEIDLEIHKLMSEKMKLYEMLESGELPNEQSVSVAKEGLEPVVETLNASRREPDPNCSHSESHASQGNRKTSGSKNTAELSHSKSSKITASCTSEDDAGHRNNGNEPDSGAGKKPKKIHKYERPLRSDDSVQTESLKSLSDRPGDSKNTISKRKHREDKSTKKKHSHSRSSSSSNRKKEGEATSRRDEQTRKNAGSVKEAQDEDDKVSEKSKKGDHSNEQKRKMNKVSETKEDPIRNIKKEAQISVSKDEIAEKYLPQIYSDESSQVSQISQECKGTKIATRGLALLEESFKRERIASKKLRSVSLKNKKEGPLKYLQKSVKFGTFSPSEEEMPLNLLYDKKRQRKKESPNNVKSRRSTSVEILDHVLETINAVAENKIDEYQRSDRVRVEMEETVDVNKRNIIRKTKIRSKTKPINESQPTRSTEDAPSGKSLAENLPDDPKDSGNLLNSKSTRSPNESDDELPLDKITEIPRSRSRTKSVGSRGDLQESSLLGNNYGKEIKEIIEDEETNWSNNDSLRLNLPEAHTFNYSDDIPQFDDSCSTFMPQDPTMHSQSISRNIKDIEKGLDVLDSMLETVSSDLGAISTKEVPPNLITKKTKRKRKGSKEDCDIPSKKKSAITKSEMMNCSVRLVDCKYTYLQNQTTERKKVTQKRKNSASSIRSQNVIEFQEEAAKLRSVSPVLPQLTRSEESPDWLLREDRLIDEVENLPSLNNEDYLTPENDLGLNNMEINSVYDDDDLEIMKLNASSSNDTREGIVGAFCPEATFSEVGNWQLLDKFQTDGFGSSECNVQIIETIGCEGANSPRLSSGCPTTEIFDLEQPEELGLSAKPFPELLDSEVDQEAEIKKPDRVLESEVHIIEEEKAVGKCGGRIDVPESSSSDQETNEIQEIQFPRIQYSVHKGPILDLKVFGDSILAASEDGVIYRYSQTCNGILNTYEGHKSAVTCIHVLQGPSTSGTNKDWLFSGSLDGSLRCFDVMTSLQVRDAADVGSPIQCMDQSWGVIFLGTKSGYVFRFHIKAHAFKGDEIKFSEESVLALKATTEGPRRVLIVASRSQPITIRDAQSGLFLRTVSGHKSHTVYSLLMDSNLVYCGTSSTAIPVFDFINGSQINLYNAGPGIVCMRIYKWLLFAGCYDGNIYVFDTKEQKLICSIPGPGNMLLSMDIVKNKIVAGSKDRRLHIWQMPEQVLTLITGRT